MEAVAAVEAGALEARLPRGLAEAVARHSGWPAFKTYAFWSIDVDLHGQNGTPLGSPGPATYDNLRARGHEEIALRVGLLGLG